MDNREKIRELKAKISELQNYLEDFINFYHAKKNKLGNLESEMEDIKLNMGRYLDELEELIDQK